MLNIRMLSLFVLILLLIGSLIACGKEGTKPEANQDLPGSQQNASDPNPNTSNLDTKEIVKQIEYDGGPAELLILDFSTGTTEEQFEKFFVEPVQAKYPQIKLTLTRDPLDKLISTGTAPDLVLLGVPALNTMLDADLPEDLSSMVKEYNIDLNQLEPSSIEQLYKMGDHKALYGLPFSMNYGAMVYNQDIFDKFGYDYPKDVMTYDESLELGRKLTRSEGGVNYIGFMPPDLRQMVWQAGLPVFDKTTGKVNITTNKHAEVTSLINDFYSVPGYLEDGKYLHSTNLFFKDMRMAMYPNWILAFIIFFDGAGTKNDFKWDLTAHPTYSDSPTSGKMVDFAMAVVNKASKQKKAAYEVLTSLLSEEVQTKFNKAGRLTVLNDPEIKKTYGQDSNLFEGKNLDAIFKVTPSPLPESSRYDVKINAMLYGEVSRNVSVEGMDINTALRNAEEKAQKEIVDVDQ